MINPNDYGVCKQCGYDLNGEMIYDYFLQKEGNHALALEIASMYGATEDSGRFGKVIYVKGYDENCNKLPPKWICPNCRKECY